MNVELNHKALRADVEAVVYPACERCGKPNSAMTVRCGCGARFPEPRNLGVIAEASVGQGLTDYLNAARERIARTLHIPRRFF